MKIELERKFTVKALAAYLGVSVEELADMANIPRGHLKQVSAGYVNMTMPDLVGLSDVTGIPQELIEYNTKVKK